MRQLTSDWQVRALRLTLLVAGFLVIVLLAVAAVASAGRSGASSRPAKAPVSPSANTTKPAPRVQACPSSTRFNPKTGSCERYRF